MQTLNAVPVGSRVKVVKIHGEGAIKRRIMDMGITKGVEIYVRKVAKGTAMHLKLSPTGDPLKLITNNYSLTTIKALNFAFSAKGK